jgi:O-methyltransferase involved in polyketide biosynthesis
MDKISVQDLRGVPETLLIPLYERALETRRADRIFRDDRAAALAARIDYPFEQFKRAWMSQVGVAVRTQILDEQVRAFLQMHPAALVVNLGAGLCTRFFRVDNGRVTWIELDLPAVTALRRQFIEETQRHRTLAASATDLAWLEAVSPEPHQALLIVAEGLLMYLDETEVRRLFLALADRFPGAHLLFEINAPLLTGRSQQHGAVSKMQGPAPFRWGPPSGALCAAWDPRIHFVEEWNLIDRFPRRWRWLAPAAWIAPLKRWMMNKIVHLDLSGVE